MEKAIADHDGKLEALFKRCRERNIKLNKEKMEFKKTGMAYIGHLLTSNGIRADPTKVEAISNLPQPSNVHGVRRTMGMVNY